MSYKLKYTGKKVQDLLEQVDKGQGGTGVNVARCSNQEYTNENFPINK